MPIQCISKKPTRLLIIGFILYAVTELIDHLSIIHLPDFFDGFLSGMGIGFVLVGTFFVFKNMVQQKKEKAAEINE
jgi:hypothetical protein